MSGWIEAAVEGLVRGAGPTTILTPIDLLDRWIADDFSKCFGDRISFNPVRTARAGVFVQVSNGRRHLIWDKEFFRRVLSFLSVVEIEDNSDRSLAFHSATFDLAALLAFQEGNFITSFALAEKLNSDRLPTSRSSQTWRLTNISRLFCYFHEAAHCEAAFDPSNFEPIRKTINDWPEFSKGVVREAASEITDADDFMHDLARLYLSQLGMKTEMALGRLDRAFGAGYNLEEVTCDLCAICDLVDFCTVTSPDDFVDVFLGVTVTWTIYDFIETLRVLFSSLVAGDPNRDIEYQHGGERNFLRGLIAISELRRKTQASLDQDACERLVLTRFHSTSARFIEGAMRQLSELASRFLFSDEMWISQRKTQENLSPHEQQELFNSLREYFLLTDHPKTQQGAKNQLWVNGLSLKSELAHRKGERFDLSDGYCGSLSIKTAEALADAKRVFGKTPTQRSSTIEVL